MFDSPVLAIVVLIIALGVIASVILRPRSAAAPEKSNGTNGGRMFRSGFERAPVGIAYFGGEGSWIDVNQKLLQLLGYSREEFLDTTFRGLTHPEDRKREAALITDTRSGKHGGYTLNKRLQKKDGEYRDFRIDVVRCADSSGGICYQMLASETTADHERSHDVCAAFEDVGEVSVIRMDAAGIITAWNRGAQNLFGYRAAEMVGKPWARLHAPERHKGRGPTRELEIAALEGAYDSTEKRVRSDATVITSTVRIIPQYAGRELTGFVEIARDATVTRSAAEYRDAYDRVKSLTEERLRELSQEVTALRDDSGRYRQAQEVMRAEIESLRTANQDLQTRNRVMGAALRKMLDRRREIELEREREAQRRVETEVGEDGLPPNLGWQEFQRGSEVSDVIVQMTHAKMTGILAIRSGSMEKRFYFENGHVVSCASNHPALLLGDLLVDRGIVDASQRERVVEVQRESGMSFGRLLVLLGMIDEAQLEAVLSEKVEREIRDLLTWREGEFAFVEGSGVTQRIVPAKVEVGPIIHVAAANAAPSVNVAAADAREEDKIVVEAVLAYAAEEPPKADDAARSAAGGDGIDAVASPDAPVETSAEIARPDPVVDGLASRTGKVTAPVDAAGAVAAAGTARLYIARKKGRSKKYHAPDCIAARSTPDDVRTSFASREAAEAKGYKPCAQCVLREKKSAEA